MSMKKIYPYRRKSRKLTLKDRTGYIRFVYLDKRDRETIRLSKVGKIVDVSDGRKGKGLGAMQRDLALTRPDAMSCGQNCSKVSPCFPKKC
jgi:hypothetical protein